MSAVIKRQKRTLSATIDDELYARARMALICRSA